MKNWKHIIRFIILTSLFIAAYPAFACKPFIHPFSDYFEEGISSPVIFYGKVTSVKEKRKLDKTTAITVEITVTRWFTGEEKKTFILKNINGTMRGTDCEGEFDFLAKKGEEWLIFGHINDGIVIPDVFNSRKITDGQVSPALIEKLEELKKKYNKE